LASALPWSAKRLLQNSARFSQGADTGLPSACWTVFRENGLFISFFGRVLPWHAAAARPRDRAIPVSGGGVLAWRPWFWRPPTTKWTEATLPPVAREYPYGPSLWRHGALLVMLVRCNAWAGAKRNFYPTLTLFPRDRCGACPAAGSASSRAGALRLRD